MALLLSDNLVENTGLGRDGSIVVSLSIISSERSFLADSCMLSLIEFSPERLFVSIAYCSSMRTTLTVLA